MEDLSIDQNNLPGVREVCRDFTVREDYSLAHNLQEQEIESHLASNIHKSRLAQQDLRVAKRLQEEEDKHAKAQSQKKHQDLERSDNRIAKEIQEQLVRQAEQQRQQEEKDEAIARKLQEREMKEERKRQKQIDTQLDEPFYEDKGACRPPSDPRVQYPGADCPVYNREKYQDLNRGQSPDQRSPKLEPKQGLESQNHPKRPAEYYPDELGHSKGLESSKSEHSRAKYYPAEKGPPNVSEIYKTEHHTSKSRTKHRKEYGDEDYLETQHSRKYQSLPININNNQEFNPTKDRLYRDDQSDRNRERNRRKDSEQEWEREGLRNREKQRMHRDKSQDRVRDRHGHKEVDRVLEQNGYRHRSRDVDVDRHGRRAKDKERHHTRDRSRGRELEDDPSLHATGRHWSKEDENVDYSSRHRLYDEVFEEPSRNHSKPQSPRDRGRSVPEEYGMREATQGLAQMNLRSQELQDLEVARRLQEEELKVNHVERRAAQVAKDEEIARRLMEEEELEYKWSREKEKQAMERGHRRADGDFRPMQEEAYRPRTRDEHDYKKAKNPKSPRLPPSTHHYENVESHYGYSDNFPPRPSRPEAAYKGAYYRQ